MSQTSPADETSTAEDADFARRSVEDIEDAAAAAEAAIESDDAGLSLEEAVGQARPDVEGTPADDPATS